MRLSNSANCFLASALFLSFISGCRYWQNTENTNVSQVPEIKSEFPFSTREPENFTVEIIVKIAESERKTLFTRSGAKRRYDYDHGDEDQVSVINSDKTYMLFPAKKVYAENTALNTQPVGDPLGEPLAWLYAKPDARIDKLETQNNITKYSVKLAGSDASEIYIYADENIGLPVKQEFYSIIADQKTLQYIMELRNFRTDVDENLFVIPKDFRRVSPDEFQRILRQ